MSSRLVAHQSKTSSASSTSAPHGLLQRKCGCGGSAGMSGECEECHRDKLIVQRNALGRAKPQIVPPIVRDVLNSPGQPLDAATRALMETRFGHDFSRVRVRTDERAASSARAVNALAYTVGNDVVFGSGQYQPRTGAGRQLIAHELAHVVQQGATAVSPAEDLMLDSPQDQTEMEAESAATLFEAGKEIRVSSGGSRLQRQTPTDAPSATPEQTAQQTPPVENCPFPSDFKDENEAGLNMMCVAEAAFKKSPSCNLTEEHFKLIDAARETARKRVEKANSRMAWLGGPEYAERIAGRVFKGTAPGKETIKNTLKNMVQILGGKSLRFNGATCADPLCETDTESDAAHAAAYESGPTEPVTLCPRSFLKNYLPELPRTIIHEAVHLSGIDIIPGPEFYCMKYSCDEACQPATSADAWALFIDCIGGPLIKS